MAGLSVLCVGGAALARTPDTMPATPRFAVLPGTHLEKVGQAGGLTTWNFTYTYQAHNYSDKFVGNAPTGAATTTPVFIIPLDIVVSGQTFSTSTVQANGKTALKDTTTSRRPAPNWGRPSMRTPFSAKAFGRPS